MVEMWPLGRANGTLVCNCKLGERHHRYIRYDCNSKQERLRTCINFADPSGQRRPGEAEKNTQDTRAVHGCPLPPRPIDLY